ncbi:MAG: penicillin-insensitive murein endopeptidase [Rhodospirillaceae bacterium]|nr:MAG: penicillin-insensitive murein endopeptidase [Rhodospirillaceae bacterium]
MAFLALLIVPGAPAQAQNWWTTSHPTSGPARAIGSPAAGCLAGGVALPLEGPGYQVVRTSRKRYFGHLRLILYIRDLGRQIATGALDTVYVGDLSQPRGGPMSYGHASHQNGLDVDIWLTPGRPLLQPARLREDIDVPSVVMADGTALVRAVWTSDHARLVHLAARPPEVDRIFVHPAIKRELCRMGGGDRSWLRKVRPWRGHSAHFHVRLACAPGEEECLPGQPLPPGDGCDEMDHYFNGPGRTLLPLPKELLPSHRPPKVALPAACAAVAKTT